MQRKIERTREYAAKKLPSRFDLVRAIHDDNLFAETKLGMTLTNLKNLLHDITASNELHHIKKACKHKRITTKLQEVHQLIEEANYLNRIATAIDNEDHNCKHFTHLIENLEQYTKHLGNNHKISLALKKNHSLLRTIYHKEELEHIDSGVEIMKEKFCDTAGSALYHYVEAHTEQETMFERIKSLVFGPTLQEEKLEQLSKLLTSRSYWLTKIAKFKARMILRKEVKIIERTRNYWKKKSAKLLDHKDRHHSQLDQLHEVIHE